jgi:hypothetical protein
MAKRRGYSPEAQSRRFRIYIANLIRAYNLSSPVQEIENDCFGGTLRGQALPLSPTL